MDKFGTNSFQPSPRLVAALQKIYAGDRAKEHESQWLDFKEEGGSFKETTKILAEAALCFANAEGGEIVLGVSDRSSGPQAILGTSLGADQAKRRIYELTEPPLLVEAGTLPFEGRSLLVVHVPQSVEIHADQQGRAPRRINTDCLPLSPSAQKLLREERQGIDFSSLPTPRGVDELDPVALAHARQLLGALPDERRKLARASDLDLLVALGVANARGQVLKAGELLFCRPLPLAQPAVVYQYRPTPGGEPRAVERLEAPLLSALLKSIELIQARRNITSVNLPDGQQIQLEDFPDLAVREALVNAVIHRDYHQSSPVTIDHSPEILVVQSPGPLVSGVTLANILSHPSKPRNPALAHAVRTLGLAEEIGRGVDRMYREMLRTGRDVPRIESTFDVVRVSLIGGDPNTQIARFVAQLPEAERDDTDTLLILYRLCSVKMVSAVDLSPVLQKPVAEVEVVLRRLASESLRTLEPTRVSVRRAHPLYRLRGETLKALGSAVPYQRRTTDEIDRKLIAHVTEYDRITNKTVQNLLDVSLQKARAVLSDLVERNILVKTSQHQRGPGVEYGPGPHFPRTRKAQHSKTKGKTQLVLDLPPKGRQRRQ